MSNFVEKEIDGIVYQAKFNGMAFSLDLEEKEQNGIDQLQLSNILFREVLVSPKVTVDDFDNVTSFLRVQKFLLQVAHGETGKRINKAKTKRDVEEHWAMYRLLHSGYGYDYNTVFHQMTPQEILAANIALDIQRDADKKAAKSKH